MGLEFLFGLILGMVCDRVISGIALISAPQDSSKLWTVVELQNGNFGGGFETMPLDFGQS